MAAEVPIMARRPDGNTLAEARLLSEFLATHYADCPTAQRVRVGRLPAGLALPDLAAPELRMLGVWRRWIDGVVWAPRETILIEASISPNPGKLSQLELYRRLFPETADLPHPARPPYTCLLLFAIDDPTIRAMAADRDYRVRIFRPRWVDAYLLTRAHRHRRAPLTQQ